MVSFAKLEKPIENPIRGFARAAFSFVRNVSPDRFPFLFPFFFRYLFFPLYLSDGLPHVYRRLSVCLFVRLSGCRVVRLSGLTCFHVWEGYQEGVGMDVPGGACIVFVVFFGQKSAFSAGDEDVVFFCCKRFFPQIVPVCIWPEIWQEKVRQGCVRTRKSKVNHDDRLGNENTDN